MSFDEKIVTLSQRLPNLMEHLHTEEATKNALVMPFIAALGYDVFNPEEVIPEYIADVGTKKGEKVDYAIKHDGEIVLLVECKRADTDLSQTEMSQLYRYFSVSKARIAILTNGVHYLFYSDLDKPNIMDSRPFLELDLSDLRPGSLTEIRKLAKEDFDLERMLSTANDLKYTSEFRKILANQLESPEEDLVRFFYSQVNPGGRFMASVKEQFTPLVAKAFQQFISDKVSDRLRSALQTENDVARSQAEESTENQPNENSKNGIVTTEEELEGYRIVKAIVCRSVAPQRVVLRDSKTYSGILLDDNNRKPICRLWFNSKQKYLGLFDDQKNETRMPIGSLDDIYKYHVQLVATTSCYESDVVAADSPSS